MTQTNFRAASFVEGLAIKAPVKVATNAPVTLSGEQTVNGVILNVGDRILVKDQADPIENGIYVVETSAWKRAGDWDGERDVVGGSLVPAYSTAGPGFIQYIVAGNGDNLNPDVDAMNFSIFYDPDAGGGATLPISTGLNHVLRADGAGGWLEETDLTISASGNLSTIGSMSLSDGTDSVTFNNTGPNLQIVGTGGFGDIEIFPDVRLRDGVYVLERAAAQANLAGYGQFWVRSSDDAPMFTTEAGVDFQLNAAATFTPPVVLLDDEQIQWGSATPDLTMEWDSSLNGFLITPTAFDSPFAWGGGQQLRLYNLTNLGYVQFQNVGALGLNKLEIFKNGGISSVEYNVGAWDHVDNRLITPVLDDYAIQDAIAGSTSGVADIDFEDGNSHYLALTENITTLTLSNPPVSGRLGQLEIEILQDTVARTIAWPASVKWPGGTAPDLSTVNATYLVHLRTRDGGTTYLGSFLENFS